jgi:hypothetical protein
LNNFKEKFLELALIHAEAIYQGFEQKPFDKNRLNESVKISNKAIDKIKKLMVQANKKGQLCELKDFIYHENKYVSCIAATYYLFVNEKLATTVLEELNKLPVPNYTDAYTILHAWYRGALKL